MKQFLVLLMSFICLISRAQNCDSTIYFANHYYSIAGREQQKFFDVKKHLISNQCFLTILDSITQKDISPCLTFISDYYYFSRDIPYRGYYVEDAIDSAVAARISYQIADTNKNMASWYRTYYTNIGKQYIWILQHNSNSRDTLRKYILSQNENINIDWVEYAFIIKDSVSFWHVYNVVKKNKSAKNYAKNFEDVIYMGMQYFGYYKLFGDNIDELTKNSKMGGSIPSTIIDVLPQQEGFNYAKKIYNKAILNKDFMKRNSVIGYLLDTKHSSGDNNISIFNYDFIRGIAVFYPELLKSKEYINHQKNQYPFFDEPLYNLLVKTIKRVMYQKCW